MSTYELKEKNGSLFSNDRKSNDIQPDYTGNCMIDGKAYKIAAWIKKSGSGKTFQSLKFTLANNGNSEDGIPF